MATEFLETPMARAMTLREMRDMAEADAAVTGEPGTPHGDGRGGNLKIYGAS
jgi:hypothetical protein